MHGAFGPKIYLVSLARDRVAVTYVACTPWGRVVVAYVPRRSCDGVAVAYVACTAWDGVAVTYVALTPWGGGGFSVYNHLINYEAVGGMAQY